ncbi:hypothetical protein evm_008282 [Chilo suppressalis]|nr:hypothetical protein evm_008282 [Chilo suppressalis]
MPRSKEQKNADETSEFSPVVNATCKSGIMSIKITFNQPFNGVAHAKEFRTPACKVQGNGSENVALEINMEAPKGSPTYCGVAWNNRTNERSVPLAVRVHRTLELADDKTFVITCGKAGFRNSRNETSLVSLRVLNPDGRKVTNVAFGMPYTLRAELSKSDGTHGIRMKNCFAFNMRNNTVNLLDSRGCPVKNSLVVKTEGSTAEITIASMFRFPDSSQVNLQCDIAECKGSCMAVDCSADGRNDPSDEEALVTSSTGIFVLDPNDNAVLMCSETGIRPLWLLYLAIALGVMFVVMLLINCFLCTAMTCSCARTDVIEKDPSVVEDYDPYRSWHGSQYGSRYPSSTIHSARSVSDNSDHYAIVQSRPGSRHSGMHRNRH